MPGRRFSRSLVAAAAICLLAALAFVALRRPSPGPRPAPLEPEGSVPSRLSPPELRGAVEAELSGDQLHSYSVVLEAGQYLHLVVEQDGVDVVVTLLDPTGRTVAEVDTPDGAWGPEDLFFVAEHDGAHPLRIRPWDGSGPGRYRAVVKAQRVPTAVDREKVRAADAFRRGAGLEREGDAEGLRSAAGAYEDALARWHDLGEPLLEAVSALRLGRIRSKLGEVAAALESYERSLRLLEGSGYRGQEASALTSIARSYRLTGRLGKALEANERALAIYRDLNHLRGVALALNNLAVVYDNTGEIEQALERYEQALAIWRQLEKPAEQATTLHNIGTLFTLLGKDAESLDFLEPALKLRRQVGDRRGEAATLTAIGWGHYLSGEPRAAVPRYEEALRLRREVGDRRGEAATLDRLATALAKIGRRPEALAAYQEAETILREVGDRLGRAHTLTNLGSLQEGWGRPQSALSYFREAVPLLREVGDRVAEAAALAGRARAERALGDLEAARSALEDALALLEARSHTSDRLGLRSSFLAARYESYELYVDLLMDLHQQDPEKGWDTAALEAGERARARGLLTLLRDAHARIGRRVEPGLLERRQELGAKIDEKQRERSSLARETASEERRAVLDRELRALLLELEKLLAEIRRQSPGYAALTDPQPLTVDQVQREILDEETALLFFSLGEERSHVWLVTRDALLHRPLPPRREIETLARRSHLQLAGSHQREAQTQARITTSALAKILFQDLADSLTSRRLVVVADGALHYVPFGALVLGSRPLIADREIVRVPSLAVLDALRREAAARRPASRLLAVVADPILQPDATHLPPLTHSRAEADAILSLVSPESRRAALGAAANKDMVVSGGLAGYRLIHFASHGLLDTEHPELSGIALSMVDQSGRPRDGFLRAHEIYDLDLPADLVVLSACRTALGQEVRGEGLVGLAGGFLYAGATRVVVSLWSVSDRATAELMRRFYSGMLEQGLPPAAALRQAQLSLAEEPPWRAPYFWAGFVLLGEWRG